MNTDTQFWALFGYGLLIFLTCLGIGSCAFLIQYGESLL